MHRPASHRVDQCAGAKVRSGCVYQLIAFVYINLLHPVSRFTIDSMGSTPPGWFNITTGISLGFSISVSNLQNLIYDSPLDG